jgi:glycine/D-amino acid oxidase-like deaminating enzyme
MPWLNHKGIFAKDFRAKPYWWDAHQPAALPEFNLPGEAHVVIVGAGYAGLHTAIELAKFGVEALVVDAAEPGFGGSTRNGGMVSGGVNVGKRMLNKPLTPEEAQPLLSDATDAFSHIEDFITRHAINCGWQKTGYFLGAWCKSHFNALSKKIGPLNDEADSNAYIVTREEQSADIGSAYYHGGMVVTRAAHLHPALYYKGVLAVAEAAGVKIATRLPVNGLSQNADDTWMVKTPRGSIHATHVVIATNGYTGDVTPQLKRRVVPVGSYIIATEEVPAELIASCSPRNRSFADTRRVLTYYRPSPDGRRMIFGGRARFGFADPTETAPLLHRFMCDRFPQLKGTRISHAWTGNVAFTFDELPHMGKHQGLHFALGCNGSGIAMMSYLGRETARKLIGKSNRQNAFDQPDFPTHKLYRGSPWFLPVIGTWFRTADWWDRRFN